MLVLNAAVQICCLTVMCLEATAAEGTDVWSPQVEFRLESGDYEQTLLWISGWSYAVTEIARANESAGLPSVYCLPEDGYITSRSLLAILNHEFEGQEVTSERASSELLAGVIREFPCKE